MTQKSIAILRQQIIDTVYTNTTNDISGDEVQTQLIDLLDSVEGVQSLISIPDSGGSLVVVGTTSNNFIEISYNITRGTLREKGTISMTGNNDTIIDVVSKFDDCGITFTKSLSALNIQLNYTDTLANGTASSLTLKVKYY